MPQVEINDIQVAISDSGWIDDFTYWSKDFARWTASNEHIVELTEEHWTIINMVRNYFYENGTVCEPRVFSKMLKRAFGKDKSSQKYIYSLFPTGLIKCANKIAGLPRPKGCS